MAIYDSEGNVIQIGDEEIASYFQTEMATTAASVNALQTEPCLTFALVTDIHYDSHDTTVFPNTLKNIRELSKRVRLDGILCLGDMTDGDGTQAETSDRLDEIMPLMQRVGLPVYFTAGNHDCNAYGANANYYHTDQMYTNYYSYSDNSVFFDDDSYGINFYKDFHEYNIRLVSLDATNTDGGTAPHYKYSANTVTWFQTILPQTPAGYTVLLITHLSPTAAHNWNNTVPSNAASVLTAINSFISNGGKIISLIGHSHSDYSFSSPYLEIACNCNKFEADISADIVEDGTTLYPAGAKRWKRTAGTATEDCFDVVVIRPLSGAINLVRFGAGEDRSFSYTATTNIYDFNQSVLEDISTLNSAISQMSGMSTEFKVALENLVNNVSYKGDDPSGRSFITALHNAMYPPANLVSISAVYTQSGAVYTTDSLDSLKEDLVVTAHWSDSSTSVVPSADYVLSGTLTVGTSVITASYGGKSTTFNVTVTQSRASIFGVFEKGHAISKKHSSTQTNIPMPLYSIWASSASYRAAIDQPIENRGYLIEVTDASKYSVAVYDIISNEPEEISYEGAINGEYYEGGPKVIDWVSKDVAQTEYIMISLKKNDNTAFTDAELANGAEAVFNYTENSRDAVFGIFENGYALSKRTNSNKIYRSSTSARASCVSPVENKGYVFTVTDSTKYSLCAYDVTSNIPSSGEYQGSTKTIAWATSDSVSTTYVWLALKKNDGTAFTAEELANGAEAVFTYTTSE